MRKINLGCGNVPLKGYTNIDKYYYPGSNAPYMDNDLGLVWNDDNPDSLWMYGDITNLTAMKDNYYDEVLMVHVIEHLSMDDGEKALRHAIRILKSGGQIDIETPDLVKACKLFPETVVDTPEWYRVMGLLYGTRGEDGEGQFHLCGYSIEHLRFKMSKFGLQSIREMPVGFGHGNNREGHAEPQYDFRLRGYKQ